MIGIDGCRGGWCVAHGDREHPCITLIHHIEELKKIESRRPQALIDIPIGLPDDQFNRIVEKYARKALPAKRSSFFPVPCRQAVYADTYEKASNINNEILGKGISIQSWNICSKIREVDTSIMSESDEVIRFDEAHPELCFHFLMEHEAPLHSKKSKEGQDQRLDILQKWIPSTLQAYQHARDEFTRSVMTDDDILDALCLWTTNILSDQYKLQSLCPNNCDRLGVEMNMSFVDPYDRIIRSSSLLVNELWG